MTHHTTGTEFAVTPHDQVVSLLTEDVAQSLASSGFDLAIHPQTYGGALIESTSPDGSARSLVTPANSSVRLVTNPEVIAAIAGSAAVGPLVAVTDEIGQVTIGILDTAPDKAEGDPDSRIPVQPLRTYLGKRRADTGLVATVLAGIESSPLIADSTNPESIPVSELSERTLVDDSPVVSGWLRAQYEEVVAQLKATIRMGAPWSAFEKQAVRELGTEGATRKGLSIIAAVRVEKMKREKLMAIGMDRLGNPPFDVLAQSHLPEARLAAQAVPEDDLGAALSIHLNSSEALYKRTMSGTVASQREELAWAIAQKQCRQTVMSAARQGITARELEESSSHQVTTSKRETTTIADEDLRVLDNSGQVIPYSAFFPNRGGPSVLSLEQWATLPTRPVIVPASRLTPQESRDPHKFATWLFDEILYSPQVCDRRGSAVGLSAAKRAELINKVEFAVRHDEPISVSQYMPMVAIGNPIKRNTQVPTLAELDVLRRLSEVSHAVELQYPPGMRWLIGNEAPAFQGPEFDMPDSTVSLFHARCEEMARLIDPDGKRLHIFDEALYLWGDETRRAQWKTFEAAKYAELRGAYDDTTHPNHAEIVSYINTYIYPMATCVDPYKCDFAQSMSVRQIAEVYGAIKQMTGSVIRGVGSLDVKSDAPVELTHQQQGLLRWLLDSALHRTFMYRVAMESRDALVSFKEIIPPHAVAYTMVTKRDKPVIYPNSGKGPYFPAHGEAVLLPQADNKQRTVVTVRPWWQIASQPDRYEPRFLEGRNEPFYFQEAAA